MDESDYQAEIQSLRLEIRNQNLILVDTDRVIGVYKSRLKQITEQAARAMDLVRQNRPAEALSRLGNIMTLSESRVSLPREGDEDA